MGDVLKALTKNILIGLSILLPVMISVQLIVWAVRSIEQLLRSAWMGVLPEAFYFPGMALITLLLLALVIGVSSRNAITHALWRLPGRILERIPLVNSIYGTVKDFLDLMGGSQFSDSSVVWVHMPDGLGRLLGIVTKSGADRNSSMARIISEDEVVVFLPMSYQAGGYMIVVARERLEPVDMEPGEAIKLIMSAGLGQRRKRSAEKAVG